MRQHCNVIIHITSDVTNKKRGGQKPNIAILQSIMLEVNKKKAGVNSRSLHRFVKFALVCNLSSSFRNVCVR